MMCHIKGTEKVLVHGRPEKKADCFFALIESSNSGLASVKALRNHGWVCKSKG